MLQERKRRPGRGARGGIEAGQGHPALPAATDARGTKGHAAARVGMCTAVRSAAFMLVAISLGMQVSSVKVYPALELPPNKEIFGGQNIEFPLSIVLTRDDNSVPSADITQGQWPFTVVLDDCKGPAENGVCAELQLNTKQRGKTTFVAPANFSHIQNVYGATDNPPLAEGESVCLDEDIAIRLFTSHYLLECEIKCQRRENVWFQVMQEFAGVPEYQSVLTRGDFPTAFCLLGSDWKGTSTFDEIAKLLSGMSYLTPDLDPTHCSDPGSMAALGCDELTVAVSLMHEGDSAASPPPPPVIKAVFSEEYPNLPPVLMGHPGFEEVQIFSQKSDGTVRLQSCLAIAGTYVLTSA